MAYCQKSDLENMWGVDNIIQWSNLDNSDTTADDGRIDTAIKRASAEIDDIMRGGTYRVPLTATSSVGLESITDIAAVLAGVWLYRARGANDVDDAGQPIDKLETRRKQAIRKLYDYLSGKQSLDAARSASRSPTAPVVCSK